MESWLSKKGEGKLKTKPFSQEVHDACDPPARDAVIDWVFHEWGWKAYPNEDKYGVDLIVKRFGSIVGYIEVETRDWLREDTKCPYNTIHVAKRKEKLLNNRMPTVFFAVTRDFKNAYWCKADAIQRSPVKEIPNKAVKEGEYFYDVPINEFHYVNLELPF